MTEESYGLAKRNLQAERDSLQARIKTITARLELEVTSGERMGRTSGYATGDGRWQKQHRLQVLTARLADVEAQLATGAYSVRRGGRRLARSRHKLEAAA